MLLPNALLDWGFFNQESMTMSLQTILGQRLCRAVKNAAIASGMTVATIHADPIFVADFNGTGSGTGGPGDIVQRGGTGSLPVNQKVVSSAIATDPSMGSGGFLQVVTPDYQTVGLADAVSLVPSSVENSWAALYTHTSQGASLNGAFDFFVRPESVTFTSATNWFRPLDVGSPAGGGMRLVLNNLEDGRLMVSLIAGEAAFTVDGAKHKRVQVAMKYPLATGMVHHLGVTFSTDSSTGVVTMKFFAQGGGGAIDTHVAKGSQDFVINADVVSSGFPSDEFGLKSGVYGPNMPESVLDYDSFRLYDSVPDAFPAIGAQ